MESANYLQNKNITGNHLSDGKKTNLRAFLSALFLGFMFVCFFTGCVTPMIEYNANQGANAKPDTPTGLYASNSTTSSITLSWNTSKRATSYKIYYGTSSSYMTSTKTTTTTDGS